MDNLYTFFETELKKILKPLDAKQDGAYSIIYVGRAAYIDLGKNQVKIEFSEQGIKDRYDKFIYRCISKTVGEMDQIGVPFIMFGKLKRDDPNYRNRPEMDGYLRIEYGKWYLYTPQEEHYKKMTEKIKEYVESWK